MRKANRITWFLFVLAGVLLIPALFQGVFLSGAPAAEAANQYRKNSGDTCTSTSYTPVVGGTLVIGPNEVRCNGLTVLGGSVTLLGEVRGDVLVFGGTFVVYGGVIGNITLFGGTLRLHPGSHVYRDINLYGGQVLRDQGAQVDGTVDEHGKHPWFPGFSTFSFPFLFLLIMIPLGLLFTWFLPEHVTFVATTLRHRLRRSFFLGLLSCVLAPAVIIVLIALVVTIPFAFIILLGLLVAWALGLTAIGWIFGAQVLQAFNKHRYSRSLQVIVGVTALALLSALPYIGWLISLGAGLIGLGAVLLSRFGTRPYDLPKSPLSL